MMKALLRQKKILCIILVIAAILLILVLGWHFLWNKKATSYDDCVRQGNPILDSYPSVCVDKTGQHFTNPAEHLPVTPR